MKVEDLGESTVSELCLRDPCRPDMDDLRFNRGGQRLLECGGREEQRFIGTWDTYRTSWPLRVFNYERSTAFVIVLNSFPEVVVRIANKDS